MNGFLWPTDLRDRWWLRFPAAVAASIILLVAGFVSGSIWTVIGDGFTKHVLVSLLNDVWSIPYIGIVIVATVIIAMVISRFSPFMLIAWLTMPFFADAKRRAYVLSFIPFVFYGWFFAVLYIVR
jgi:hypothetical protein